MNILGIIPCRMASSRFPNKPLVEIQGMPMIEHIYKRSIMSKEIDEVFIATCDESIVDFCNSNDLKFVLTSNEHERATERCAEALIKIEKKLNKNFDVIVMIQGDEPLINPQMLDSLVKPFIIDDSLQVCNLINKIKKDIDVNNQNVVKVVKDIYSNAMYFSREAIPSSKLYKKNISYFKQLGLISFSRESILKFISLEPTDFEIIESVDMNRFIENNIQIKLVETTYESKGVDTYEDFLVVNDVMENDDLFLSYNV
tara:strand:- start:1536 stop:2306 length:771 start_codon:yes stop_codon:yes gene_type:complete